jgi:hypothetical protein
MKGILPCQPTYSGTVAKRRGPTGANEEGPDGCFTSLFSVRSGSSDHPAFRPESRGLRGSQKPSHHKFGWPKGVEFIEGHHPADASLFVRTTDLVALSLLQARLTELGTGIEIEQIDEYIY